MVPDFNQKTIDILAKRAAFKCSNPDCRVNTVGPNIDAQKPTIIGEAAHIFGARPESKRYNPQMTNITRAEITNAIWLCRNCHKLIDTDEKRYTSDMLFAWREQHEKFIFSELGNTTDRLQFENEKILSQQFENCPPIIRRIVIDQPPGWEYRLTAELMRYYNNPIFRKIHDLRNGLYIKNQNHLEAADVLPWIQKRLTESTKLVQPLVGLLDSLNKSWGPLGVPGSIDEIHHITLLIKEHLEQIISHEEQIYFINVPEEFEELIDLLKDKLGSQAEKFANIPNDLDEIITLNELYEKNTTGYQNIEYPYKIEKIINFDLPKNWENDFNKELRKAKNLLSEESTSNNWSLLLFAGLLYLLFSVMC